MGIGVSVSHEVYWLVFVSVFFSVHIGNTQLLINVKNQVRCLFNGFFKYLFSLVLGLILF